MSGDANTVRACFSELAINEDGSYSPRRVKAEAALARLEACETQRDTLAEALLPVESLAESYDLTETLAEGTTGHYPPAEKTWHDAVKLARAIRAALAEAATREETT